MTSRFIDSSSDSCSSGRVVSCLRCGTLASQRDDNRLVQLAARSDLRLRPVGHPIAALLLAQVEPHALRDVDLAERAAAFLVGSKRNHRNLVLAEQRNRVVLFL